MIRHTLTKLALAPALAMLANCGPNNRAKDDTNGGYSADNGVADGLHLTSSAFQDGQPIPTEYSCDGANASPALKWDEPPAGTRGFALVIDDQDAPSGIFRHWGTYDIPASARGIASGQHLGTQVNNDGGKPGYTGPCPPKGNGVHHYQLKVFALDTDKLDLSPGANAADVEQAASRHALARGELTGTYERR